MAYILALDQGTTSSRAILFDASGSVCGVAQKELTQIYPHAGWVEHDPQEIWSSQVAVAGEVLARAGVRAQDIAAIGITNQRETTLLWDRATGLPLHNAIVWQDRRTADLCEQIKGTAAAELIAQRTGLVVDAYFSATKLKWLLDNVPDARRRAEAGELAFGTVDSWLLWKLSGGAVHLTDVTNASRTMLFDIRRGAWDADLLHMFGIPAPLLPQVKPSSSLYAETAPEIFAARVPVTGVAGDQQAALFGQRCVRPGMVKNTYGTGCFMLMHTGGEAVASANRLLTTAACPSGQQPQYALEGSVFIAGGVVQWLRDGLGIIRSAGEVEALAGSVSDSGGVYFVPAFVGLGTPHWDPYARGALFGLTRGSTSAHIARAALESIAYQTAEVVLAMQKDSGIPLMELRVDGGACANDLLMQFQADLLGVPVVRPRVQETTALGAAYLAGLAGGFWGDEGLLNSQWQVERRFEPRMGRDEAASLLSGWQRAVSRTGGWAA